jgi:Holliday junction DNA helicase RuvA
VFEFLRGTIVNKTPGWVVLEIGGVGFMLQVSDSTARELPGVGQEAQVYTYLHVREDALILFGFGTPYERDIFLALLGVEGIGTRTALAALSAFNALDLAQIICSGDATSLRKISGIGKKMAQRVILELKEKLMIDLPEMSPATGMLEEDLAVQALLQLGYSRDEVASALTKVEESGDVGARVRAALEVLRKR